MIADEPDALCVFFLLWVETACQLGCDTRIVCGARQDGHVNRPQLDEPSRKVDEGAGMTWFTVQSKTIKWKQE